MGKRGSLVPFAALMLGLGFAKKGIEFNSLRVPGLGRKVITTITSVTV